MSQNDDLTVLLNGLDQVAGLLDGVTPAQLGDPTPCKEWTVGELIDHVVQSTANFASALSGQEIDWTADPTRHEDQLAAYRQHAERLRVAWREVDGTPGRWVGVQSAEFATHTWDLARALGRSTDDLDQALAEGGLAFLQTSLTPETRGSAFEPEQQAPEAGNAYERIAAFAGRPVSWVATTVRSPS